MSNICKLNKMVDEDFPAMKKKKSRNPKPRDKWSVLWFVPTQVLNLREVTGVMGQTIKKGKRIGFDTFNQLTCKICRKTFHKYQSLAVHSVTFKHGHVNIASSRCNELIGRSHTVPISMSGKPVTEPSKRSSRLSNKTFAESSDEVEILNHEQSNSRNNSVNEISDKKFGKLNLSAKRKIVEDYNALEKITKPLNKKLKSAAEKIIKTNKSKQSKHNYDANGSDSNDIVKVKSASGKVMMVKNAILQKIIQTKAMKKVAAKSFDEDTSKSNSANSTVHVKGQDDQIKEVRHRRTRSCSATGENSLVSKANVKDVTNRDVDEKLLVEVPETFEAPKKTRNALVSIDDENLENKTDPDEMFSDEKLLLEESDLVPQKAKKIRKPEAVLGSVFSPRKTRSRSLILAVPDKSDNVRNFGISEKIQKLSARKSRRCAFKKSEFVESKGMDDEKLAKFKRSPRIRPTAALVFSPRKTRSRGI